MDDGADLARALDGFYTEHRRCGLLDGGVEDVPGGCVVWMECSCGARIARRLTEEPVPPCQPR